MKNLYIQCLIILKILQVPKLNIVLFNLNNIRVNSTVRSTRLSDKITCYNPIDSGIQIIFLKKIEKPMYSMFDHIKFLQVPKLDIVLLTWIISGLILLSDPPGLSDKIICVNPIDSGIYNFQILIIGTNIMISLFTCLWIKKVQKSCKRTKPLRGNYGSLYTILDAF